MGPRTLVRGNHQWLSSTRSLTAMLQWGRALSCAEIPAPGAPGDRRPSTLQWGRALSCAEIGSSECPGRREEQASMGPRTLVRGNESGECGPKSAADASMGPRTLVRG